MFGICTLRISLYHLTMWLNQYSPIQFSEALRGHTGHNKGRGQNRDHRGHIHSHRGQAISRRGQNSHIGVRFVTTVAARYRRSHAALAQPQNQTRDSSNTQFARIPCFQRFSRYSVHSLCIK